MSSVGHKELNDKSAFCYLLLTLYNVAVNAVMLVFIFSSHCVFNNFVHTKTTGTHQHKPVIIKLSKLFDFRLMFQKLNYLVEFMRVGVGDFLRW